MTKASEAELRKRLGLASSRLERGRATSHRLGFEQWLKRFDIEDDELMAYKAKLLNEPKLTATTTLPDRL